MDKIRVRYGDRDCGVRLMPGITAGQVALEAARIFGHAADKRVLKVRPPLTRDDHVRPAREKQAALSPV